MAADHTVSTSVSAQLCGLIQQAARAQMLEKAVFSKCHDKTVVRAVLTLRRLRQTVVLQWETFRAASIAEMDTSPSPALRSTKTKSPPVQASQVNLPLEQDHTARLSAWIAGADQVNLFTTAGHCEFKRSKGGKEVLLGANILQAALADTAAEPPKKLVIGGHDRVKHHLLTGAEPFLIALGISDEKGRVHDKKQPKFRQINRFLELIRDMEAHLPQEGTLHICDLCCGKSYLSFAVYHYFTVLRHRTVQMVGVDMKDAVMQECNAIAQRLGMQGLSFVCADVSLYAYEEGVPVDMVISLHACDTATDLVLDKAIAWGAKLILATPCCHHAMMRQLDCPDLAFIAAHSMLKQKLCDAATDALRLARLESFGYEVDAVELIDPEETPKNVMLRARLRYDPASARCRKAAVTYARAKAFLTSGAQKASAEQTEGE